MTYLLDTHTLIWALTEPSRLGRKGRAILKDRGSDLVVSAASAWEIATKHRIGRLPDWPVFSGGYPRNLDRLGVGRLSVTEEHGLVSGALDWDHRDPFDRMLAAQAMIESMTLITNDAVFKDLPGLRTMW